MKTLFDPCPTGWRVPQSGAEGLSPWPADVLAQAEIIQPYPGLSGGYYLPAFPAAAVYGICGSRSVDRGFFMGGSQRAWWWTTTIQGTQIRTLSIYVSQIVNQTNPPGDGDPVRCIRE